MKDVSQTMKRLFLITLSLLVSTQLFAEETQRYMVATRSNPRAGGLRIVSNSAQASGHRVRTFRNFNAFAADLTPSEVAELRRSADVELVTPVIEREAFDVEATSFVPESDDAGPNYTPQVVPWGITALHTESIWPVTRGGSINVAVLDTGIDFSHPDLQRAYAGGFNAQDPSKPPMDDNKHGTHVSGTIAATDNDFGTVGLAPDVRLWAVKVLASTGRGTDEQISAGIDWVVSKAEAEGGRWVINMSLGSRGESPVESRAVQRALDAGIVVVAAAGNDTSAFISYPARYPGVIAVGAFGEDGTPAEFSNYGPGMSIMAPGVNVPSTMLKGVTTSAEVRRNSGLISAWGLNGSPFRSARGKMVYCGLGHPEEIPSSVAGKIALVRRGVLTFREKARNAKEAGAIAVIVINNEPDDFDIPNWNMDFPTCNAGVCEYDPGWEGYEFPLTIGVPRSKGEELLAAINDPVDVAYRQEEYGRLNGTSMATPHVAAIAALLLALDNSLRPHDIKWVVERTSIDLNTPGWDMRTAWGRIDALAAAQYVAPERFGGVSPTPRSARRRSGH